MSTPHFHPSLQDIKTKIRLLPAAHRFALLGDVNDAHPAFSDLFLQLATTARHRTRFDSQRLEISDLLLTGRCHPFADKERSSRDGFGASRNV
jgi:hypothetical protein